MKVYRASLVSASNLSFSKFYRVEAMPKESPDAYEARTWRERLHYDDKGHVYIPAMMQKNCLAGIAQYLGETIKGRGKRTWTKIFESGLICPFNSHLFDENGANISKDDVQPEWLFVPSNGRRGGETRVEKCFPLIKYWEADWIIQVVDESVTKDVLEHHLHEAGLFMGVGRFRPSKNGIYGRFALDSLDVLSEDEVKKMFAPPAKRSKQAA